MDVTTTKITFLTVLGTIGGAIAWLFGGWTTDLQALLIFMAVDYATGLILAGVFKKSNKSCSGALESRAGLKGLFLKVGILMCVLIAHWLGQVTDVDFIRTSVIVAFICNEGISIIENLGLMGVPVPESVKNAIDALKNKK
jgi:toxin secretion/phage lysis holin